MSNTDNNINEINIVDNINDINIATNNNVNNNLHYDAFISYRHLDPDSFAAKKLHKKLESFRLPGYVSKKHPELPKKINRVFRDEEELPLSSNLADPITEALINCDNLIVICTPKLKESKWCLQEIETFIKYHGRKHIFTALVEGEPEDSFPEILMHDEYGNHIEPLAADFRGKDHKEISKKIDSEILRLIAPMYELNYDDLKQRHREQKMRRIMALGGLLLAATTAFGIYFGITAYRIQKQADLITEQKNQILDQALEIENQYIDSLLKYETSIASISDTLINDGRKMDAVYTLLESMPDTKENSMIPYCANAEYALNNAMQTYAVGNKFSAETNYENKSHINDFVISPDSKFLVSDNDNTINIFNTKSGKLIDSIEKEEKDNTLATFINNDEFIYFDKTTRDYMIYNLKNMESTSFVNTNTLTPYIATSSDLSFFILYYDSNIYLFDCSTKKEINTINLENGSDIFSIKLLNISDDNKYIFTIYSTGFDTAAFKCINLDTFESFNIELEEDLYYSSICFDGENIYLSVYTGFLNGNTSKIMIFNKQGEKVNEINLFGSSLKEMNCYEYNGDNYIFGYDNTTLYSINTSKNEIEDMTSMQNKIVSVINTTNNNLRLIILNNNEIYAHNLENHFTTLFSEFSSNIYNENILTKYANKELYVLYKDINYITRFIFSEGYDLKNIADVHFDDYSLYLSISQDGKTGFVSESNGQNHHVTVYKTSDMTEKFSFDSYYNTSAFVNNGKDGLLQYESTGYELYDIDTGKLICQDDFKYDLIYFNSTNTCYYTFDDDIIKFYNILTDESFEIKNFKDLNSVNSHLDISNDNNKVVVSDKQNNLYIINTKKDKVEKQLNLNNSINTIFFSDDSKYICVVYKDKTIDIIDAKTYEVCCSIFDNTDLQIRKMIYIPENNYYLLLGYNGYLLNENIDRIASINKCIGYDNNTHKLIFRDNDLIYSSPIFTYEELIKLARQKVVDYSSPDWVYAKYGISKNTLLNDIDKYTVTEDEDINESDESSESNKEADN